MKVPNPSPTLLPILNGLVGDKLAQSQPKWAVKMSFRVKGQDIPVSDLDRKLLGHSVVIFVHGLMAHERIWDAFDFGKRPKTLHVRYNTGLHISDNGQALAELIHAYQQRFSPKRILLVGHSMGGLVVRSACYYAEKRKYKWIKRLSAVFLIAVPNAGAALEKIGHVTSFVLRRIASFYLGLVGNILDQRSNGIKDLRLGSMVEEDWKGGNYKSPRTPVPPISGVDYHILVGSLSKDEKSLMARYFGDGLVTPKSAVPKTLMQIAQVKTFPKAGHNAILKREDVRDYIRKIAQLLA